MCACWVYMCIIHQNMPFLQTCKSRKISCFFAKAKNKKKVLLRLEPSPLRSNPKLLSTTVILTAPSNRLLKTLYFVIYGFTSDFTDKGQFQYLTNLKGPQEGLTCIQHNFFH